MVSLEDKPEEDLSNIELPPDDDDDDLIESPSLAELCEARQELSERQTLSEEPKRELKIEQLEFPLPARLPRFNALDFMKFYRSLQTAGLSLSSVQDYIVAYLNMYFICISTSRTEVAEIICETNGEWTIETEYILRNDTETKKRLVKCKVLDDNNKWINAYDVWMSSLSQELRHGIDFRPDQRDKTDDNMMNTFFGFKADIDGQHKFIDTCDLTKINHILDLALNLCGNNKV